MKHPLREFPLNNIHICSLGVEQHPTKECPSLQRLKVVYKGEGVVDIVNFMGQRRPW